MKPIIVPFKAEHLAKLHLQPAQKYMSNIIDEEYAKVLEGENVHSFSLLDGGLVLACGGVAPMWHGRAIAWMIIAGEAAGFKFLNVHKAILRFFETCYINRIEATVDCDFEQGHRWMRMLGFKMEAERMKGYRPDGGDCALYARVRS